MNKLLKDRDLSASSVNANTLAPLRAMQVIAALANSKNGLTLAELCEQLQLPKTSLFSLLRSLNNGGYVDSDKGHHQLGQGAYNLASMISKNRIFPANLRPLFEKLHQACGETVMIAVQDANWTELVYVDVMESDSWLSFKASIGSRRPLYCTAPGLLLLAFAPSEYQTRYIDEVKFKRHTPKTIMSRKALVDAIKEIRATGLSISSASVEGATGLAAPVLGESGGVVAAVNLAGLSARIERDIIFLSKLMLKTGEQMSRVAGYKGIYPRA